MATTAQPRGRRHGRCEDADKRRADASQRFMRIARGLWPRGRLLRSPPAYADNLDGHPGKLLRKARGVFGVLGVVLPLWLPRDTCTLLRPVGRHEDGVRVVSGNCAPVVTPRACALPTLRPTTEILSASISAGDLLDQWEPGPDRCGFAMRTNINRFPRRAWLCRTMRRGLPASLVPWKGRCDGPRDPKPSSSAGSHQASTRMDVDSVPPPGQAVSRIHTAPLSQK